MSLRKYLHAPTFIVGNLVLDIEPMLVLVFGLRYPLHGYLHAVVLALAIGLLLGFVIFKLEGFMSSFYGKVRLETDKPLRVGSFLSSSVFGLFFIFYLTLFFIQRWSPSLLLQLIRCCTRDLSENSVYDFGVKI